MGAKRASGHGTAFNPHKRKYVNEFESAQNNFIRKLMIRPIDFLYDQIPSYIERNANFRLKSLSYRRRKFDLIMLYKIDHRDCGLNVDELIKAKSSTTRVGCRKIVIPNAKQVAG